MYFSILSYGIQYPNRYCKKIILMICYLSEQKRHSESFTIQERSKIMNDIINDAVEKYGDSMYRCAYTYCHNRHDAEDIVQEVFSKLLTKNPVFNDERHKKAWLLRVTINTSKDYLRSFWRRNVELIEEEISIKKECCERDAEIWKAVNDLPQKYRIIIKLYYTENYTIKEIADLLNTKVSTIGTRFERAKKMLKERIEEKENNNE